MQHVNPAAAAAAAAAELVPAERMPEHASTCLPLLCLSVCCTRLLPSCRVATTGLLALLCCTYPALHLLFIALIALDIFSHWFQMYASLLAGSSTHKVRLMQQAGQQAAWAVRCSCSGV
jgi:hypothetical protein